ncbi:MAG: 4-(cytidine 5'-diphospho)-2-C-methyl-D-erythritol kinase [Betaproteobacteria bacterium HGW-Betaproteobacteria-22]|nr:MAG: 4-(cytidine 5'-diphospho)-2-C-methyl-D-erythritol kinase [Betaproteobacteria bacterium HGW-Betaproteobacteria-22]
MNDFKPYPAPAKINLFLHITGQRADGYHLLQTVFRLLDFYDTVYLKPTNNAQIKHAQPIAGIDENEDLCVRAAKLLQQHAGCRQGVEIHIEKKIPMGGGLGGGSSDAATTLLALNRLWQLNLTRQTLVELGTRLGADVPFFIYGDNAWAEGIGEKLQAISLHDAYYVVLTPKVHVSTAQIFANKQLTKDAIPKTMSAFSDIRHSDAEDLLNKNVRADFINQLEKVVCDTYPEVSSCLAWLKQFGDARMSGSGASVFLEVFSEQVAKKIIAQKPEHFGGFVAKGLDQHPLKYYAD